MSKIVGFGTNPPHRTGASAVLPAKVFLFRCKKNLQSMLSIEEISIATSPEEKALRI
jgi:hypothetical protein